MFNNTAKYAIVLIIVVLLISACNDTEKLPQDSKQKSPESVTEKDYVQKVLPSIVGFLNESKGGIGKLISHDLRSDSKSRFVAVVIQLTSGDFLSANIHFEGEYNKTQLSLNHPFIVICEKEGDCNDCGFITTEDGTTTCGCRIAGKESPCMLSIDHITDYDFFANYDEMGKEILPGLLGEKK